ncbi:hypothetical protein C8255_21240, partial [filamentous cyanobacterium CCP3]
AIPNTALWNRLKQEQRLPDERDHPTDDPNTPMSFIPTRPIADLPYDLMD